MVHKLMAEVIAYLSEVKNKQGADSAALRFAVDKWIIMSIGGHFDAQGSDTEHLMPEIMKHAMELHRLEKGFLRNKHYGSTLMAYAWDHAYGMTLPEASNEEKAAAVKILDEQDAKKTEDILASAKDLESADAAARALMEKLVTHHLLTVAGHAPKERRNVSLSPKEMQQIKELQRTKFHGSLLLSLAAREWELLSAHSETST